MVVAAYDLLTDHRSRDRFGTVRLLVLVFPRCELKIWKRVFFRFLYLVVLTLGISVFRIAEEIIYGTENVTTGASNDFMQVSRVARQMVERFGFSKKIGQLSLGGGGGNPFLGQSAGQQSDHSMATADIIDAEVRELVETAYTRAKTIMTTHIDILHKLASLLLEKETVDGEEFLQLFIDGQAELYVN